MLYITLNIREEHHLVDNNTSLLRTVIALLVLLVYIAK